MYSVLGAKSYVCSASTISATNFTLLLLITIFFCGTGLGQKTQTEVVRSVNPAEDVKPNSSEVAEVIAQSGEFERIIILRLKHKADLLEGLTTAVEKENIRNAVILSGIGSARGYHYHVVSNRDFPSRNYFVKDPTHPVDICNMNGYIIDGRVHAHVTFSDDEKAFGGHLEPDTDVFTFAIVTVGVLSDAFDLSRVDDKTYR
jgi:predicted DNA-binding protein with PD1-like motif